jgi:hypothetical protein
VGLLEGIAVGLALGLEVGWVVVGLAVVGRALGMLVGIAVAAVVRVSKGAHGKQPAGQRTLASGLERGQLGRAHRGLDSGALGGWRVPPA